MPHRNARLTVRGKELLVGRVCAGRPIAHAALHDVEAITVQDGLIREVQVLFDGRV
ncbi:hypothetical protein OG735_05530 [Streptomyces sp. NBC_01210]|uniref:hypothetical protein n=1 Tax=Streptomyces sp. NBC_01210 TaxID=2903774 RepID=UPI002E0F445E|nr:hypothetical protein OG735_05530 [Streptomyces sp. NBC_01210]